MKTTSELLIGKVFARLTVRGVSTYRDKKGRIFMECVCECGKEKLVSKEHLVHGKVKSCGCLREEFWRRGKKGEIKPEVKEARIEIDVTGGLVGGVPTVNKSLDLRERAVCDKYLSCMDKFEAYLEAYRVGDKDPVKQKERLRGKVKKFFDRPEVVAYLERGYKEIRERYAVDLENSMRELSYMAHWNIKDFVDVRPDISPLTGLPKVTPDGKKVMIVNVRPMSQLSREQAAAISKVVETANGIRYEFHNKIEANRLLGEHVGAFPKKVDFNANINLRNVDPKKLTPDELRDYIANPHKLILSTEN